MSSLNIFLTTWNTGLQGSKAQSQDLTSWLLPVLQGSSNDPQLPAGEIPDIYAISVQELLPLHLALAGLSGPVLLALTDRIESLLCSHAKSLSPDRRDERYTLVSREAHCGVALWVFARDSTMSGRLGKALTARIGLWWYGMGNKGAVGVRLPVRRGGDQGGWEVLTFVGAHLEAYDKRIKRRNEQYQQILSSLLFYSSDPLLSTAQIHHTSHLFIMGDLNYRLVKLPTETSLKESQAFDDETDMRKARAELIELDTLKREQAAGRVFGGLREGDLTNFAPTYKRIVGQVNGYSRKRIPGYTDRILFASHTDSAQLFSPKSTSADADDSTTQIVKFLSTPELTISDHKPVHAILVLPPVSHSAAGPHLAPLLAGPPPPHSPRPRAITTEELFLRRLIGTTLDKLVGWPWTVLVLLGFGNAQAGMGVGAFVAMIWGVWWSGVWSG